LHALWRKLKSLEQLRRKQESLFDSEMIAPREIEQVYAGIYLDAVASFEAFIEDMFIGLLAGHVRSPHGNIRATIAVRSQRVARDVFFRTHPYFNWLSYDNTERAAEFFFRGGRPFTLLSKADKAHLRKCLATRHAIAHHSRYALNTFREKVLAGLNLMPRQKRPGGFLRAQFCMSPPMNYYQHLTTGLASVAKKLT
jgi:hypothetical protein